MLIIINLPYCEHGFYLFLFFSQIVCFSHISYVTHIYSKNFINCYYKLNYFVLFIIVHCYYIGEQVILYFNPFSSSFWLCLGNVCISTASAISFF